MLAKESKEMEQAAKKLMVISQDEEARARAMSRENSEYAMRLHERGIREDEQSKGKVEKEEIEQRAKAEKDEMEQRAKADKVERAHSMVEDNLSVETIERYTGLSVEEIKLLQGQ